MLRITINGSQVALNMRRRIQLMDWDSKRGNPIVKDAITDDLHLYLETMRNKAYQGFTELSREYDDITPHMVRDYIQGVHGGSSRTLIDIWQEHNEEIKRTIGKEFSYSLWQKHNTAINHYKDFLRVKYRMSDMPIKQIKYNVIREFFEFLLDDKGLKYNTSIKFLQLMKKITNRAIRSSWLKVDPFEEMSFTLKETDRPYLTDEELKWIIEREFHNARLGLVKDLFLFSCYTGMAYADVKKLHKAEIERTPDGLWWIKTRRQKTKQKIQIPLLATAKDIIDKYTDISKLKANEKVLPVMSNQKLNSYLKEVADLSGIEKNLTFHVARHTFATTVTLQNGVSIESVSRMLGHSNIKSTQHYARIVDKKVAEEMMAMTTKTNLQMAR
ncbi:MAG: site-specific recombinase XerD [bacterium]|jgi:site-specific recombinase XerD